MSRNDTKKQQRIQKSPAAVLPGMNSIFLTFGQFALVALLVHHIGVVQTANQIGFDRINIDPAQLVPLGQFFRIQKNEVATKVADTMNDTYLKTSGDNGGIASYGQVCDLLVSWHIQTVVLPSIAVEESKFDPYDESQIDLSGIVNAR